MIRYNFSSRISSLCKQENGLADRARAAELRWGEDTSHLHPPFDLVPALPSCAPS